LRSEYLAVLETDNATPYYLNLHNGEVAHTLILGMTGSGKSFLCNFLLTNAQKYRPQTYIFDIGGSFHSLTEIFGGTYLNVGQEIYTNDAAVLSERLSTDVTKTSAVDLQKHQVEPTLNQQTQTKEPPMTNSREHSQEELRRQILAETNIHAPENISTTADIEHRHNAPIQTALPNEASDYAWKRETGEVQSYQHNHAGNWLHIDPQGQFYDRQAQPITRENALEQAGHTSAHSMGDNAQVQPGSGYNNNDQGISL
jgi:hypothetical protein